LETLESTFECLKVTPFNFPSVDAREVEQKLKDQVPHFEPAYFRRLNFDQALVSVFGLSKFQEIIVSTFAECTCATDQDPEVGRLKIGNLVLQFLLDLPSINRGEVEGCNFETLECGFQCLQTYTMLRVYGSTVLQPLSI
jgi:hypothetical protein